MANSNFLVATITIILFMALSIPSHQKNIDTPTISAAPAVLPDPPVSPHTELSPDIAPLLPSPGGPARSPAGLSMPTIPSTRSPNPDTINSVGPDAAVAPSGSFQNSSAASHTLVKGSPVEVFSGFLTYWLVMLFMI